MEKKTENSTDRATAIKKKSGCGGCSKLTKASKYLDLPFGNGQKENE